MSHSVADKHIIPSYRLTKKETKKLYLRSFVLWKRKIWSVRIKKRYSLVNYIFSFQSLSEMKRPLQPFQKRKWLLLWGENHRLVSNNDYIVIFSFHCLQDNKNADKSANLFPFLSYDKWNGRCGVEPHAHRVYNTWLQYLSTPNDGRAV